MARSLSVTISVAALGLALCGCNAIAGINDPVNGDVTSGDGGTGDGGTGVTPSVRAARFLGTWVPVAGQQTTTLACPGNPTKTSTTSAPTLIFTIGSSPDEVILTPKLAGCDIPATVTTTASGAVATVGDGETCTVESSDETDEYTYETPTTFSLNVDGTASAVFTASLFAQLATGNITCQFNENDTFMKTQ